MFLRLVFSALLLATIPAASSFNAPPPAAASEKRPLETVPSVDLNRYMGDWYEIARTPNRYENDCIGDVKVHYSLMPDGRMALKNECRLHDGKMNASNGRANIVDTNSRAKLRVTFFWPFFADYWIIDLDKDYRYAVVGEPDRKYLWVISRAPQLDDATYNAILKRIAEHGYDLSRITKTQQSDAQPSPH